MASVSIGLYSYQDRVSMRIGRHENWEGGFLYILSNHRVSGRGNHGIEVS
jgi:hypothetical protein